MSMTHRRCLFSGVDDFAEEAYLPDAPLSCLCQVIDELRVFNLHRSTHAVFPDFNFVTSGLVAHIVDDKVREHRLSEQTDAVVVLIPFQQDQCLERVAEPRRLLVVSKSQFFRYHCDFDLDCPRWRNRTAVTTVRWRSSSELTGSECRAILTEGRHGKTNVHKIVVIKNGFHCPRGFRNP